MPEWPRVTQLLRDLGVMQGSPWYQPKHRRRGRIVDHCCNLLAQGKRIETEWWSMSSGETEEDKVEHETVRPFVEAYQRFLRDSDFELMGCAVEVKNAVARYVGHADQVGGLHGEWTVLDIKTGGEAPWHKWQLAAYADALRESEYILPHRYNLYLTDDGKYRLVEHRAPKDIAEWRVLVQAWWIMAPIRDWDFREVA